MLRNIRRRVGYAMGVPIRPLTGAELAEKYGFEPVPDWKKDPFVRPMRPLDEEEGPITNE